VVAILPFWGKIKKTTHCGDQIDGEYPFGILFQTPHKGETSRHDNFCSLIIFAAKNLNIQGLT